MQFVMHNFKISFSADIQLLTNLKMFCNIGYFKLYCLSLSGNIIYRNMKNSYLTGIYLFSMYFSQYARLKNEYSFLIQFLLLWN